MGAHSSTMLAMTVGGEFINNLATDNVTLSTVEALTP